jgi:hypothetical protein
MKQAITITLILIVLISCDTHDSFIESRLKTAEKFIDCLKNNMPDKMMEYCYPDIINYSETKEMRAAKVKSASEIISKFGLPSKKTWIIKYDPQNNFERLVITIPFFEGLDTALNLAKAKIIVAFPPYQISDKVYKYEIETPFIPKSNQPVRGINGDSSKVVSKLYFNNLVERCITLLATKQLSAITDTDHIQIMMCLNTIFMRQMNEDLYQYFLKKFLSKKIM